MPHYKDGTEAKLGDHVRGKPYNYPSEVSGIVTDIRAGDSCNLTVAFVAPKKDYAVSPAQPAMTRRAKAGAAAA